MPTSTPTLRELAAQATPGKREIIIHGTENASVRLSSDCVISGTYRGCESDMLSPSDAQLIARLSPDVVLKVYECLDYTEGYLDNPVEATPQSMRLLEDIRNALALLDGQPTTGGTK